MGMDALENVQSLESQPYDILINIKFCNVPMLEERIGTISEAVHSIYQTFNGHNITISIPSVHTNAHQYITPSSHIPSHCGTNSPHLCSHACTSLNFIVYLVSAVL